MKEADEYYLEARDAVLDAVKELDPRRDEFSAPGEVVLRVRRKPAWPLRFFVVLQIARSEPGMTGWTLFNFERGGGVALAGTRKVPLAQARQRGQETWASRGELAELAGQLKAAAADK